LAINQFQPFVYQFVLIFIEEKRQLYCANKKNPLSLVNSNQFCIIIIRKLEFINQACFGLDKSTESEAIDLICIFHQSFKSIKIKIYVYFKTEHYAPTQPLIFRADLIFG